MQQETLLKTIADEQGYLTIPDHEISISIRDENLLRYETEHGDLLLRTETMPKNTYLEIQPGINGIQQQLITEPDYQLTQLQIAQPEQTNTPSQIGTNTYRLD